MAIRRLRLDPAVLQRRADGKVVEILPAAVAETQQTVHRVIEITADAGSPQTLRFGFQLEDLTDEPGFPEQTWIEPGSAGDERVEACQHAEGEGAVPGD